MNGAPPAKPIAVVQGASSDLVQSLFRAFVERHRVVARIVGVVMEPQDCGGPLDFLRDVQGGDLYRIFQNLGSGAASRAIDPAGVIAACETVRRDIAGGCDLVVLSKFAQLEVDRGGLASAFAAAIEAQAPILTSVAPKFMDAWARFASPLYVMLPPRADAIEAWWGQASNGQAARCYADSAG